MSRVQADVIQVKEDDYRVAVTRIPPNRDFPPVDVTWITNALFTPLPPYSIASEGNVRFIKYRSGDPRLFLIAVLNLSGLLLINTIARGLQRVRGKIRELQMTHSSNTLSRICRGHTKMF